MKRCALLIAILALPGCDAAPLGYLDATSPVGAAIANLGIGLTAISAGVCVVVGVLLAIAIWRRRPAGDFEVVPVNDRSAIRWIGMGVAISTGFLLISVVWSLVTLSAISEPRNAGAPGVAGEYPCPTIEVVGERWWWRVRYLDRAGKIRFTTANEIRLPVGQPVRLLLKSKDVIHSFWVPKLGGKMDMIPSRTNTTWIEADKPGVYRGQCAEYCGAEHALMAFFAVAMEPDKFKVWAEGQSKPATKPTIPQLARGQALFLENGCGACHTVRGTPANGGLGPDLTHVGGRLSIGAGLLPNNAGTLAGWISSVQHLKPHVLMPSFGDLKGENLRAIAAYLEGLE